MTNTNAPDLDLVLEREINVPPELVWAAWTTPEHLKEFFAPKPYTIVDCEIDLRPGGAFRFVTRSPEGDDMETTCCYLEVDEGRRLVWTELLGPGYRPIAEPMLALTAAIDIDSSGAGTRYTATAMHADAAGRKAHEEMGFHEGWGLVLDQLVAHMRQVAR